MRCTESKRTATLSSTVRQLAVSLQCLCQQHTSWQEGKVYRSNSKITQQRSGGWKLMDNKLLTATKGQQLLKRLSGEEPACQCRRHRRCRFLLGQEDPLEVAMATHSNISAWRILWTDEPGGLQSMRSQRRSMHAQLPPYFLFFLIHFAPTPFFKGKA